jgi:hypothetical protein
MAKVGHDVTEKGIRLIMATGVHYVPGEDLLDYAQALREATFDYCTTNGVALGGKAVCHDE